MWHKIRDAMFSSSKRNGDEDDNKSRNELPLRSSSVESRKPETRPDNGGVSETFRTWFSSSPTEKPINAVRSKNAISNADESICQGTNESSTPSGSTTDSTDGDDWWIKQKLKEWQNRRFLETQSKEDAKSFWRDPFETKDSLYATKKPNSNPSSQSSILKIPFFNGTDNNTKKQDSQIALPTSTSSAFKERTKARLEDWRKQTESSVAVAKAQEHLESAKREFMTKSLELKDQAISQTKKTTEQALVRSREIIITRKQQSIDYARRKMEDTADNLKDKVDKIKQTPELIMNNARATSNALAAKSIAQARKARNFMVGVLLAGCFAFGLGLGLGYGGLGKPFEFIGKGLTTVKRRDEGTTRVNESSRHDEQ